MVKSFLFWVDCPIFGAKLKLGDFQVESFVPYMYYLCTYTHTYIYIHTVYYIHIHRYISLSLSIIYIYMYTHVHIHNIYILYICTHWHVDIFIIYIYIIYIYTLYIHIIHIYVYTHTRVPEILWRARGFIAAKIQGQAFRRVAQLSSVGLGLKLWSPQNWSWIINGCLCV